MFEGSRGDSCAGRSKTVRLIRWIGRQPRFRLRIIAVKIDVPFFEVLFLYKISPSPKTNPQTHHFPLHVQQRTTPNKAHESKPLVQPPHTKDTRLPHKHE